MRITKISVKGLFGMFDHEIPLNQESRITIIHGPNGVGKTVLMRMVHGLFNFEYEFLGQTPFESLSVFFKNGGVINVHRISDGDVLLATYIEENGSLVSPPFEVKLTSELNLYEEAERLLPDSQYVEGGGTSFWEVETEGLYFGDDFPPVKGTRRLTRAHLLEEYPQIHTKVYGEMPDWFSNVRKEANTSLIQTQRLISDDISYSELEESKRLNELEEGFHFPHPEPAVAETRIARGIARKDGDARNTFEDIINAKFLFKSFGMDENNLFGIFDKSGNELDMIKLSSGEQHLLVLYFRLLFNIEPDTLVMIDEPELSMNVVWQRNFLKDLQRIIELRKFDVLIATHSPQIIHDKWDWMVPLGENIESDEAD